ncbi:U32 family peptidase [Petroclostridium sp. X23]|uniref:peptidase U32 family protein n=1 Tax=Petroclostridium sp. X23 TaxID=3045146 RepID=UPI0024ADC14C|nr:U32 family peptidase [Petroclostridium sp. X23]WHH61188.1 U32 family peptidase [Petroclostridium sp. X23]
MSRFFNGKVVELLAPAGTFDIFKEIIGSGADAVYLGGKKFNMRMHRKDYNLSNDEIKQAIEIAHSMGKKLYITFNNMMSDEEIDSAKEYLLFLNNVRPDALIIQDMGALSIIKQTNIDIPLHASVMMNVHNKPMIDRLRELGVSRVVMSREASLQTISKLSEATLMEYEYFVHGDMCAVHGAQCLYSGLLFGKSSNRGLCMKPCRWPFHVDGKEGTVSDGEYHLAVKDMCMYRHIPELICAGVNSFKIEGRMRDSKYLVSLINIYRNAIDRYLDDPAGYYTDEEEYKKLYDSRQRELSTGYAFKVPGSANIDLSGKREPRVFSRAVEEFEIEKGRIKEIKIKLNTDRACNQPLLVIKVNNMASLKQAVDHGADEIYLAGEVFKNDRPFNKREISKAIEYAQGKKIYYALPRMMFERQFSDYQMLLNDLERLGAEGVVITNFGAVAAYSGKKLKMVGDYALNCYNSRAADFYHHEGLNRLTLSVEAPANVLKDVLHRSHVPIEIVVQGAPVVMYTEHCVYAASSSKFTSQDCCEDFCEGNRTVLVDEQGCKHPIYADQYCRNHMITSKDICLLPLIKDLCSLGVGALRIEGQHYQPEVLGKVVAVYRDAIKHLHLQEENDDVRTNMLKEITGRGQTLGALNYD